MVAALMSSCHLVLAVFKEEKKKNVQKCSEICLSVRCETCCLFDLVLSHHAPEGWPHTGEITQHATTFLLDVEPVLKLARLVGETSNHEVEQLRDRHRLRQLIS